MIELHEKRVSNFKLFKEHYVQSQCLPLPIEKDF
jgi:hypothetical protein